MLSKINESGLDRIIRVVLGAALVVGGFFFINGMLGIVLGILGLVFVVTGAIGFCPIYAIAGLRTNKTTEPAAK